MLLIAWSLALWPAGKIQTALYELEDHWAAVHQSSVNKAVAAAAGRNSRWPQLIAKASKAGPADAGNIQQPSASIGNHPQFA